MSQEERQQKRQLAEIEERARIAWQRGAHLRLKPIVVAVRQALRAWPHYYGKSA